MPDAALQILAILIGFVVLAAILLAIGAYLEDDEHRDARRRNGH